jgi:adenylosuccinate lyase
VIAALLAEEQPFLATETLLMRAVAAGADRQEVHEAIRQNAAAAAREIKEQGGGNRLLDMLAEDRRIPFDREEIGRITAQADFTGRAEAQVEEYLAEVVRPLLNANRGALAGSSEPAGEVRV